MSRTAKVLVCDLHLDRSQKIVKGGTVIKSIDCTNFDELIESGHLEETTSVIQKAVNKVTGNDKPDTETDLEKELMKLLHAELQDKLRAMDGFEGDVDPDWIKAILVEKIIELT